MIWDLLKLTTVGCGFFIVVHITWDYVILPFVVQIKTEMEIIIQFAYSSRLLAIPSPDHWSSVEFQILSKFFTSLIYSCISRSPIWKVKNQISHHFRENKFMKFAPIEISQNVNLFFLRMYWKHGELRKAGFNHTRWSWSRSRFKHIQVLG